MSQLTEDLRPVTVNAVGDLAIRRNRRGVPGPTEARAHLTGGMNCLASRNDQPDSATRPLAVVGNMVFAGLTSPQFECCEVGEHDKPVAEFDVQNPKRTPEERRPVHSRDPL